MDETQGRVRVAEAIFQVGQHVRISKYKMHFAKATEQYLSSEIFSVVKVIESVPRAVYELED